MATSLVLISGGATAPAPPAGTQEVSAPSASKRASLYDIEEALVAYGDSVDLVAEGQEEQFLADFRQAMMLAVEKRDRVGWFMAHLDSQTDLASAEIKRLQDRKAAFVRTRERIEHYLEHVIKTLGQDEKGRWRKLEGNTVTFSLKKCPDSVQLLDESAVPQEYKNATITIPLHLWDKLLDSVDIESAAEIADAIRKPEVTVRKADVKTALQANTPVPGAKLADTKYSLVVK